MTTNDWFYLYGSIALILAVVAFLIDKYSSLNVPETFITASGTLSFLVAVYFVTDGIVKLFKWLLNYWKDTILL